MSPRRAQRGPRIGGFDHLIGFALCVAYVVVLLAGSRDLGMSRDESFYVVAAQDYAVWFRQLASDVDVAMEQEVIDAAWDYNHEHPGLAKSLFALSWLAHERWDVFPDDSTAFRFPGMVSAGLLLWLLYIFGARVFGRSAGLFAALAYALMPRPFYHAHLDCFDVPITLTVTLCIYAYWRSLRSPMWSLLFGVCFGLSLATKHNTWILPGIFFIHFIWMTIGVRAQRKAGEKLSHVSLRPWWLITMSTIGPVIFLATWPWLWNDTLERIGWYVRFHTGHEYYNIAYLGTTWFEPPFPVHYPFLMTVFTVSAVILVLAAIGLGLRARAMLPLRLARKLMPKAEARPDATYTDVLLVGALLAPMVVIALPSSPIFGGTKHWMPAYPFIALYAGLGFWRLSEYLKRWVRNHVESSRVQSASIGVLGAMLLAPSFVETVHSHPFGLSHYTLAAGGVPGAADLGLNRQFWGFTTGSLVDFFNEEMPDGGTVWLCDTTDVAWRMLQRDGLVPNNIRPSWNMARADYILVHHEEHFAEVDGQAWLAFGSAAPAKVLTYDGVPIISVYENPRRREERP